MFYPIVLTTILFFAALGLKAIFKNLCALCFAFAGTWAILILADFFFKIPIDPVILGIYMGGSNVGLMYYLYSKLPEELSILKLPFLVTFFFLVYSFLSFTLDKASVLAVVSSWSVFLFIFLSKNFPKFKNFARKVIECCKNW